MAQFSVFSFQFSVEKEHVSHWQLVTDSWTFLGIPCRGMLAPLKTENRKLRRSR
jgi:hypothetical protein